MNDVWGLVLLLAGAAFAFARAIFKARQGVNKDVKIRDFRRAREIDAIADDARDKRLSERDDDNKRYRD